MYERYFGLREKPFSLTPNARYVFYSDRFRSALEFLEYGIAEKEGFMLVTGLVGTGKTLLCRVLLDRLDRSTHRTALVFNPFLSAVEMLQALLTEFGCSYPRDASQKELLDRLNRYLLAQTVQGNTCIAIFDEAQHLSEEFLEQIRVLSNLETEEEKLLQIILVGQPELRDRIRRPSLAQLDQRVSLRCTLSNLEREETERYIYHRLNAAGARGAVTFTGGALRRIHGESDGIPRLINLLSDRALLAGYVAKTTTIGRPQVVQGLASLRGDDADRRRPRVLTDVVSRWRTSAVAAVVAIAVLLVALGAAAAFWYAGSGGGGGAGGGP